MKELGVELRVRRVEMGLSCQDVYRKLRIPVDFIVAIEAGNCEALPASVYAAGFLRTYCEFLQLDPDRYVNGMFAHENATRNLLPFSVRKKPGNRPIWFNEVSMWATVVLIALLGWGAYTLVIRPHDAKGPGQVQAETLDLRLPRLPEDSP